MYTGLNHVWRFLVVSFGPLNRLEYARVPRDQKFRREIRVDQKVDPHLSDSFNLNKGFGRKFGLGRYKFHLCDRYS